MAKQKQKQIKKQTKTHKKSKSKTPTLPSGYKVIGRAPNWDFEKNPVVVGERGAEHKVVMDKGTKKERTVRNFILQEETLGAITIWESSMLKQMFDETDEGHNIRIEFLGYGEAKKNQNAPKLFSCAVSSDE
jgi:hypothetical protein